MKLNFWPFRRTPVTPAPEPVAKKAAGAFEYSTHKQYAELDMNAVSQVAFPVQQAVVAGTQGKAMDAGCDAGLMNSAFRFSGRGGVPDNVVGWFLSQGFIGHQLAAVMSQQWLINRACKIPGEDACRNGWKIEGVESDRVKKLEKLDRRWRIKEKCHEFSMRNRVFGIRIAMFLVDSNDPGYYEKPFNIDGVAPGSYRGISQVDPVWCQAELVDMDVRDPSSANFYEPTYWRIGNRRVHRSHLVIIRYSDVPSVMRPTYQFGGIPLPQLIWERVYGAERSANEAPQLLLTKRMNVLKTDLEQAMSNPERFQQRQREIAEMRDNYGLLATGTEDDYSQHETSLADVDSVIMTGYQLVAAVAGIPAVKILQTSPKGFNPTGDFETGTYRETLAGVQEHELSPFLERHYLLANKSMFGDNIDIEVVWNALDEPTEAERAATNLQIAQTAEVLISTGAVGKEVLAKKLAEDETLGYSQYSKDIMQGDFDDAEETRTLAAAVQSAVAGTGLQSASAQANQTNDGGGEAATEGQPGQPDANAGRDGGQVQQAV